MSIIHISDQDREINKSLIYHLNSEGPDQLCAANSIYSHSLASPVLLRSKPVDINKFPPMSLYTIFTNTVSSMPHHNALGYKKNDLWCFITYREYFKICIKAAKSFIKVRYLFIIQYYN